MVVTDGTHRVTGDLTPDSTGDYVPDGLFNGEMSYVRKDSAYFIWWDGLVNWIISQVRGEALPVNWFRNDPEIKGLYPPGVGAAGIATVTEI